MNNQDLITVVVPVYNVEAYLDECVASLVGQTCTNLEILLVDDGATDESGRGCDRWAEKDPRIRVIHKENGGLSDARNAGLREARGKYVAFVDSDDCIAPTFLETLYGGILREKAQVSCCAYVPFEDGEPVPDWDTDLSDQKEMSGPELIRRIYTGHYLQVGIMAWNKLYERSLFQDNGIQYPKGKIYEDTFTTCRLLYYAPRAAVTECRLYGYRQRNGSIMRGKIRPDRCINGIEADYSNVAFFKEKQESELTALMLNAFFKSTIQGYRRVSAYGRTADAERCRQLLLTAFRQVWRQDRDWFRAPLVKKAAYGLFALAPEAAIRLLP